MKKILFICTGNSARSIMAESLMNHHGGERYRAFSAGAAPAGEVNPLTLETLEKHGRKIDGLRSKPLPEFRGDVFDLVITVCDNARESCPIWPSQTKTLHWSFPDPAAVAGDMAAKKQAFEETFERIERRILKLLSEDW